MTSQNKKNPILVLGGTGHYGRHIVRALLDKDIPVRVLSRNRQKGYELLGDQVMIVEGDITSAEDIQAALQGVEAVIISVSAFSPQLIRQMKQIERDAVLSVLRAAEDADVRRVVYISVFDVRQQVIEDIGDKYETARIKQEVESALARTSFNWTVLGAPPSMEIFFALIRGDTLSVPGGGPPALPTISPVDVGEIAAQTVLRDDLHGLRIRMVGPDLLSFPQAAKRISAVTGKRIRFRAVPLLPIRVASYIVAPFYPYLRVIVAHLELLNNFPADIAEEAGKDHQWLLEHFDYNPTTLEKEATRRMQLTKSIGIVSLH